MKRRQQPHLFSSLLHPAATRFNDSKHEENTATSFLRKPPCSLVQADSMTHDEEDTATPLVCVDKHETKPRFNDSNGEENTAKLARRPHTRT
jgi:hypothetical protein